MTSSQRIPITTNLGHTDRALSFYESNSVYFALGKTSKWSGEDNQGFIPPEPSMSLVTLEELVCLKKVSQKQLVVPDDSGTIFYDKSRWRIVTPSQAIQNQSRWVYITSTLYYDEIDLTTYRQVGLFNRVTPNQGETSDILLPDQISDLGCLIAISNRYVTTRQVDTRDTYNLIIEF